MSQKKNCKSKYIQNKYSNQKNIKLISEENFSKTICFEKSRQLVLSFHIKTHPLEEEMALLFTKSELPAESPSWLACERI